MKKKQYNVSINYGGIVEAENEEKAKEEFRNCIDNTFFKLDVELLEETTNKYNLDISEKGVLINETLINERIFQEEKHEYTAIEKEDQINHLISWISEAKGNDKELMIDDLKYLINLKDEYLFSSISTNDFIAKSDDEENFNRICKELLKLN